MKTNNNFNWLILNKAGQVLAGAVNKRSADEIAAAVNGTVKENNLVEMTGELAVNKAGFWFGMGEAKEDLVIALRRVMDLPLNYPARATNELTELGYVTITIKPATRPDEISEAKYREVKE